MAGPVYTVEAAFVANPFGTLVWTDITAFLEEAPIGWDRGKQADLNRTEPGKLTLVLKNTDGRFDPGNTASPYYPYVQTRTPIRVRATYNAVTYDRWRGFVKRWPQRWSKNGTYGTVTVTAVDALDVALGVTLTDPYEIRVQKYYNVGTGQSGAATNWSQQTWDGTVTADGTTIANTAGPQVTSAIISGTGASKSSDAISRTSLALASGTVLRSSSQLSFYEQWLKFSTLPTLTNPGDGAMLMGSVGGTETLATRFHLGTTYGSTSIGGNVALKADGRTFSKKWLSDKSASSANGNSAGAVFFTRSLVNAMPSENASTFATDTSAWTATGFTATRQTGTGPLAEGQPTDANCLLANPAGSTTATFLSAEMTYDNTKPVGVSCIAKAGAGTGQYKLALLFYDASHALLTTVTSSQPLNAVTNGATGVVQVAAVANAVYFRVGIVHFSGATASDTFTVGAFMLLAGTTAPPSTWPGWTSGGGSNFYDGAWYYEPVGQPAQNRCIAVRSTSTGGVGGQAAWVWNDMTTSPFTAGAWHLVTFQASSPGTAAAAILIVDKVNYPVTWTDGHNGSTRTSTMSGSVVWGGLYLTTPTVLYAMPGTLKLDDYFATSGAQANQTAMGQASNAAVYDIALSGSGQPKTQDFPAQDTGTRVGAVLDAIGWPATERVIDVGATQMQASGNNSGKTASSLLSEAADTELGNLFIDGRGRPVFQSRRHAVSYTPSLTFGEAETPYSDAEIPFDDTRTYNDVQITQTATTGTPYVASASDAASQVKNGVLTLPKTLPLASTADTDATARTLLNRYRNPQRRIEEIAVDLRTNPTASPTVLAAEIGDVVGFMRRPPGLAAISIPGRIVGIREKGNADTFEVTFLLDPIPADAWIAGDAKQSVAGVTTFATY